MFCEYRATRTCSQPEQLQSSDDPKFLASGPILEDQLFLGSPSSCRAAVESSGWNHHQR